MAFIQDLGSNSISVVVVLDDKRVENDANTIVHTFGVFSNRAFLKVGVKVHIKHVEMSREKFDEITLIHRDFPCFRFTRYRALQSRGILGSICGITVYERENTGDMIKFVYKDVDDVNDFALPDPFHISAPKNHLSMTYQIEA